MGTKEQWEYNCDVCGREFKSRPYKVIAVCPEHEHLLAEFIANQTTEEEK